MLQNEDHQAEKFIPKSENMSDGREGDMMKESQFAPNSATMCSPGWTKIDSGSGANAVSSEDMIINVTVNPLSELVWSPDKGVSLKCTNCSLLEKKSSFLWSGESANMRILSPEILIDKINDCSGTATGASSMQTTRNQENGSPNRLCLGNLAQAVVANTPFDNLSNRSVRNYLPGQGTQNCGQGSTEQLQEVIFEKTKNDGSRNIQMMCPVEISPPGSSALKNYTLEKQASTPVMQEESQHKIPPAESLKQYTRKEKRKALCGPEFDEGNSEKEKNESQESVESCNNRRSLLTQKRAWSSEQLTNRSKRSKGQDSSFVNWIFSMANGFQKFDLDTSPSLEVAVEPFSTGDEHSDSLWVSDGRSQGSKCKRTGFQNVFRALYSPNLRKCNNETGGLKEKDEPNWLKCDNEDVKRADTSEKNKLVLISNGFSSVLPDIPSSSTKGENERSNHSSKDGQHVQCELPLSILSRDNSGSPEAIKIASGDLYRSSSLVINKPGPFESLWKTRFNPKVLNSGRSTDVEFNKELPCSEPINLESQHEQPSSGPGKPESRNLHDCLEGPPSTNGSKHTTADQKLKSKLNPILPSQQFKHSDRMATMFARRLDALRHIIPSNTKDNVENRIVLCFFCGSKDHTLRDCTELLDSELEELLRSFNLDDGEEDMSCLCIRCFHLSHWAIACPHTSKRKSSVAAENKEGTSQDKQNKSFSPRNDGYDLFRGENKYAVDQCPKMSNNSPGKNFKLDPQVTPAADHWMETSKDVICIAEHVTLSPKDLELKCSQDMPMNSRQVLPIPRRTFEAVRKLRLSRAHILRWIKSPVPNLRLEGYFLRVRLGKWEEGLGGTGYHVACIHGVNHEEASETCETLISVHTGNFKCLVNSRYISNHDFSEEELIAWWSASLKAYSKLPSEEDLDMKLAERRKYKF